MAGTNAITHDLKLGIIVAHFNHRLRGVESDRDAEWVRRTGWWYADRVVEESAPKSLSEASVSEETARTLRYQFLTRAARQHNCRYVAVAHTADDQAETILHHILRGTGIAGLRGIPRTRELDDGVILVRPLLETSRKDIVEWLHHQRQSYCTDSTNQDMKFTRNWIRHGLLPQLATEFNPQIVQALLKLGRQVVDTDEALKELAESALRRCDPQISRDGQECVLDVREISELPRHVLRGMFVLLWTRLGWPRQRMDYRAWNALAGLVDRASDFAAPQYQLTLPGHVRAIQFQAQVKLVRLAHGRKRDGREENSP
jgi:tRNA(Ile)-lysidine synthase